MLSTSVWVFSLRLSFASRTAACIAVGYFSCVVRMVIVYIPYIRKPLSLSSLSDSLRGLFWISMCLFVGVVACTAAVISSGTGWLRTGTGVLGLGVKARTWGKCFGVPG